jgi:membrane-associated phospholipid phosphatase
MPPSHLSEDAHVDWLTVLYLATIALIVVVSRSRVADWGLFVLCHSIGIAILLAIMRIGGQARAPDWRWLRYWYPAALLFPLFDELSYLIHRAHPRDYDTALALLDRRLFGVDPVAWLQQFARPWLTEGLQLAYTSFYLLPLVLLLALYAAKRFGEFRKAQFGMLLCFYLSYLGYFIVPALGPRFISEGVAQAPRGLFLSGAIQNALNQLEGAGRMRDAFPSGHAAVALVVQWYAFRYFRRRGFWLLPLTTALLFSTVYLAYHYVVDVLAGAGLAVLCVVVTECCCRESETSRQRSGGKDGEEQISV